NGSMLQIRRLEHDRNSANQFGPLPSIGEFAPLVEKLLCGHETLNHDGNATGKKPGNRKDSKRSPSKFKCNVSPFARLQLIQEKNHGRHGTARKQPCLAPSIPDKAS